MGATGGKACCETSAAAMGPAAAECLATGVSLTEDDATRNVCVSSVTGGVASNSKAGAGSFATASDVTVEFTGRCVLVAASVSERDVLDRISGVTEAVGAVLDRFVVASSGVGVLAVGVALIWAPPVLTATPAGAEVVVEPVEVEVMLDGEVDEAADVFEGVEDAGELDISVSGLAVGEVVDGDWPEDAAEVESEDDELDGSAHATPWLANSTTPTPSATARLQIRHAYASPRTRQLYRRR